MNSIILQWSFDQAESIFRQERKSTHFAWTEQLIKGFPGSLYNITTTAACWSIKSAYTCFVASITELRGQRRRLRYHAGNSLSPPSCAIFQCHVSLRIAKVRSRYSYMIKHAFIYWVGPIVCKRNLYAIWTKRQRTLHHNTSRWYQGLLYNVGSDGCLRQKSIE